MNNRPELVKGFVINHPYNAADGFQETLYAVTKDGEVYACGPRPYDSGYYTPDCKFSKIEALPKSAEFIGNYRRQGF